MRRSHTHTSRLLDWANNEVCGREVTEVGRKEYFEENLTDNRERSIHPHLSPPCLSC
jgi:hypothetical protein